MAWLAVLGLTRDEGRVSRLVRTVASRVPRLDPDKVAVLVRRETDRLRALGADRRRLAAACGWAAADWVLDAGSLWVLLAALGYRADPLELFIAFGLANVLGLLPLAPGGLGIVEGILIPTLIGFGSPAGTALLGVLAWRLINFWLPIPVSALTWLSLRVGPLRHHTTAPAEPLIPPGQDR